MKFQTFKTIDDFLKNVKKGDLVYYYTSEEWAVEIILKNERNGVITSFYLGEIISYYAADYMLMFFKKPIL